MPAEPGSSDPSPSEQVVHATTVSVDGRAVLIRGVAGSGKSSLALQMLALGADLVADDRTRLWRDGDRIMAEAPATIAGRIEARGVGILAAPAAGPTPLAMIIDMDHIETSRLPEAREEDLLGLRLPLLAKAEFSHFPSAVMLYLANGCMT